MYLIKLEIPLHSRQAAGLLADGQQMHRIVTGMFGQSRRSQNILYRTRVSGGMIQAYLYADALPAQIPPWITLTGQRDLSQWVESMRPGDVWRFDLLTMPSKKVYQAERGQNSRRRLLRLPEERIQWLQRKAEQNGFSILQAEEREQGRSLAKHHKEKGGTMYLDAYRYEGVLRVEDAERFRQALRSGVGPGKAYGLGMLLLRRV